MANDGVSRRDFLRTAAVAAGATGAAGAAGALGSGPTEAQAAPATTMPRRTFGKSGIKVPILALGGIFDTPNNQLVLRQALRLGVTYWDTAERYGWGRSELGIGMYLAKNPTARKDIFLVSKGRSRDPKELTKALDQSLKRLKTSYVDLYFVHAVDEISELGPGLKAWGEQKKKEGKIKLLGFSSHQNMAACLAAAPKLGWVDGIMFTYNYRVMNTPQMRRAVEACHRAGIGLTAMKTQGGRSYSTDSAAEAKLVDRFTKRGFTPQQAHLKAVWEDNRIASICSAMYNLTVLASNVAAALDRTKLSAIDHELLRRVAAAGGYCAGCGSICQTLVSGGAPVADVMRCLMYARQYGDRDLARETYAEIPTAVRVRLAGLDYGPAEKACPQGVPIGRLMREAVRELA
ncbi:MAG: aldo/keto reductase [Proteobacteria bacterium]|nr:aldo/keto reductase [Pseudomonadota bacterium]